MQADHWTKHINKYDQIWVPKIALFAMNMMTLTHLTPQTSVVDIACGSGSLTLQVALAQQNEGHSVLATDFSDSMIQILYKKMMAKGFAKSQISTLLADEQMLEVVPSDSANAAFTNFGMFMFPNRMNGWISAFRTLKKGGILVSSGWDANFPPFIAIEFVKRELGLSGMVSQFLERVPSVDIAEITEEIKSCGFENVLTFTINHDFIFNSGQELLDAALDNEFFQGCQGTQLENAKKLLLQSLAGLPTPIEGPLEDSDVYNNSIMYSGVAHCCIACKPVN